MICSVDDSHVIGNQYDSALKGTFPFNTQFRFRQVKSKLPEENHDSNDLSFANLTITRFEDEIISELKPSMTDSYHLSNGSCFLQLTLR